MINSVLENVEKAELSIFPNPTQEILNISYPKEITEVRIYDEVGRLHQHNSNNHESISVSHLKSGLYAIQIHCSDGEIANSKFIKE